MSKMVLKRKVYAKMLEWKEKYAPEYALSFKMNGRTYYQGLMFSGGASYNTTNDSLVSLNVENYKTLKFTAGHIDNTTRKDASVTVYRDNVRDETATIEVNRTMKLKDFTLDVGDTKVLRFYVERGEDSAFAFADFSADAKECAVKHTVAEATTEVTTGDVNGDGEISVEDAQLALVAYVQTMAGLDSGLTEQQTQAADVNGDKTVSVEDAQTILIYYVSNTLSGQAVTWDELLGKNN